MANFQEFLETINFITHPKFLKSDISLHGQLYFAPMTRSDIDTCLCQFLSNYNDCCPTI